MFVDMTNCISTFWKKNNIWHESNFLLIMIYLVVWLVTWFTWIHFGSSMTVTKLEIGAVSMLKNPKQHRTPLHCSPPPPSWVVVFVIRISWSFSWFPWNASGLKWVETNFEFWIYEVFNRDQRTYVVDQKMLI